MIISEKLKNIIENYQLIKDTEGKSPALVYKLHGKCGNLYIKISKSILNGTTYDVEKEKDVMQWLNNKLTVPNVLHYECSEDSHYLIMSEINGITLSDYHKTHKNNDAFVSYLAQSIKKLREIDIKECPFNVTIDKRLSELQYLIKNELADVDCCNWEQDNEFKNPQELFDWLCNNKPREELVFSHGDLCASNIIIQNDKISGFIDLGRAGYADKWYDIAFCVREIKHKLKEERYIDQFFDLIDETPDWEKIRYFILLDELF